MSMALSSVTQLQSVATAPGLPHFNGIPPDAATFSSQSLNRGVLLTARGGP